MGKTQWKGGILLYKQGDSISHAYHGVGTIESIEEKELLGSKAIFVTLYFDRESLKVIVPKRELDEQVRKVMTREEGLEVLDYLKDWDDFLVQSWKQRTRNNHERMISGNPKELCVVIKGLFRLQKKRGSLSNSDQNQLRRAVDILSEELANALGQSKQLTSEQIESFCYGQTAA